MGVLGLPALWAVLAPWWRAPEILLGSWPPKRRPAGRAVKGAGFLEDPALGLALACWGSAEWGMGACPTALPHRPQEKLRRPSLWEGGLGRALCLSSATWGAQWGSRGPLVGCSQAPSLLSPSFLREVCGPALACREAPLGKR